MTPTPTPRPEVKRQRTPGGLQVVKATNDELLAARASGLNNQAIAERFSMARYSVWNRIGPQPATVRKNGKVTA